MNGDEFFEGVGRIRLPGARQRRSAVVPLVRRRPGGGRSADGGPPADGRVLLAQLRVAGLGHLRRGHAGPAVEPTRTSIRWSGRSRRWRLPSSSSRSSACRSSASTTATSHPTGPRSRSPPPTSTRWSRRRPATWSGPASGCSGARPTSSRTRGTRRAPPPTPTPRCSPTRPRRCAPRSTRPTASGARTTCCGAGGRATTRSSTPTSRAELDQLARFLHLVVEHKHRIGFEGTILIEPKPAEPAKHQYDHDAATVAGFLARHGLDEVKVNLEANHATLAGHSFHHEVATAIAAGVFGSVDANRGDPQNGWDTDQFPSSVEEMSLALYEILALGWADDRRVQLRHEAAPPVDRTRRPLPRARRRDGHAGPGVARRRVAARVRRPRGATPRALRGVAGGARRRDQHGGPVARRPPAARPGPGTSSRPRCRAGRSSWRTSSTATSSGPGRSRDAPRHGGRQLDPGDEGGGP